MLYISSSKHSSEVDEETDVSIATSVQQCCSDEILRRGGLILFCDYAVSQHSWAGFTIIVLELANIWF